MCRFSGVGAQGREGCVVGGNSRAGQEHGGSSGLVTPELEHPVCVAVVFAAAVAVVWVSQLPMAGNDAGIRPKSWHASLERKG